MKARKILILILGIIIAASLSAGCSKKADSSKDGKATTTSGDKKEKEEPTKEEFLEQSKKIMNDMASVCDKYSVKYEKNDELHADSEHKGTGYFINKPGDTKLNDGADNTYRLIRFGGTVSNDGSTGQKVVNLSVQQDDSKTQFDVNTCKLFKDMVIAITGDSNYDFEKLNKKIKEVQDKREAGTHITDKETIGEYTQEVSVILEGGTNQKILSYSLYTGDVKLKK